MRLGFFSLAAELLTRVRNLDTALAKKATALQGELAARKELQKQMTALLLEQSQNTANALHDDIAPVLAGLALKAKALEQSLQTADQAAARSISEMASILQDAGRRARRMARALHPVTLEEGGLIHA